MGNLAIMIPVLDDWESVRALLPAVDSALSESGIRASVLIIDDGSRSPAPTDLAAGPLRAIAGIRSLRLRRNLGHQRAIATGLAFLQNEGSCDSVVVMDADGEDRPEDIPRLLERLRESGGKAVIFAKRGRRSEGLVFRIFYCLYRIVHVALTGVEVPPGNFSAVPAAFLPAVTGSPDSWIHYAASVRRLRIPIEFVTADRGKRLKGRSRMNFPALVAHGLRAMSVQSDVVVARLAVAAAV
ncbi:MAG: glycosyltransferase, partial [Planctomycetota bacterium]|nr:glycosyltransferase [Planctomycetota bacterium]